jgi:hypothetical protein
MQYALSSEVCYTFFAKNVWYRQKNWSKSTQKTLKLPSVFML